MSIPFRGVIFDVDGVLEYQGRVYGGAVRIINKLRSSGVAIRVLTNSTLKSRRSCAQKLQQKGFPIAEDQIITASYATAEYLRQHRPCSCWILLNGDGLEEFHAIPRNSEQPDYIVIGDCREDFSFHNMNRAVRLLVNGSKLLIMIPEVLDSSLGELELTVGAYGGMLERAAETKAVCIGKPNPYMFQLALRSMDIADGKSVLMVGDKIDTDIAGAKAVGIRSALIKKGEFREEHLSLGFEPDYILDSIDQLDSILFEAV